MNRIKQLLANRKLIIGMIHVQALPATPENRYSVKEITQLAVAEAKIYEQAGSDAIMLENMHDIPYLNTNVGPEIISAMSVIASEVRKTVNIPCGIQILAGANKAALAVAKACDLDFVRVENFAYAHIADEGIMQSCAGELLRYRKYLEAQDICLFTDVKKKHSSHTITRDVSLGEAVKTCDFFLSDGIIITGASTGIKPEICDLEKLRNVTNLPVLIGSGITAENISDFWHLADAFIVGSYFKEKGIWSNPLAKERIELFMEQISELKRKPEDD